MKVLITGGNGYIAKSLYASLSNLHEITLITREDFDLTNSVQTAAWFSNKMFDVVVHTAIVGGSRLKADTTEILDSNLRMYYNLLDNKKSYTKFISIGSGAELYQSSTPYGLSKHVIRQSILEKDNFYNLRIFAVFDENELDTRFIKSNILRYIKNEPMVIFQDKKMDFFYMKDFVKVINFYIENNALPKEFDCSYETSYYLSNIASQINSLSNYEVDITIDNKILGNNYVGVHNPLGISFSGLEIGIKNVYNELLCKK